MILSSGYDKFQFPAIAILTTSGARNIHREWRVIGRREANVTGKRVHILELLEEYFNGKK